MKNNKEISNTQKKLLESAKEEFLEKGYKSSSLRNIVKNAGFTLGAFYGYYKDKKSLFSAVVEDFATDLLGRFKKIQEEFALLDNEEQKEIMSDYSYREMSLLIDFIYDNYDVSKVLFCRAAGTEYENFADQMASIEESYTYKFMDTMKKTGVKMQEIPPVIVHLLSHTSFIGMLEILHHDLAIEDAKRFTSMLHDFSAAGWNKIWACD